MGTEPSNEAICTAVEVVAKIHRIDAGSHENWCRKYQEHVAVVALAIDAAQRAASVSEKLHEQDSAAFAEWYKTFEGSSHRTEAACAAAFYAGMARLRSMIAAQRAASVRVVKIVDVTKKYECCKATRLLPGQSLAIIERPAEAAAGASLPPTPREIAEEIVNTHINQWLLPSAKRLSDSIARAVDAAYNDAEKVLGDVLEASSAPADGVKDGHIRMPDGTEPAFMYTGKSEAGSGPDGVKTGDWVHIAYWKPLAKPDELADGEARP